MFAAAMPLAPLLFLLLNQLDIRLDSWRQYYGGRRNLAVRAEVQP